MDAILGIKVKFLYTERLIQTKAKNRWAVKTAHRWGNGLGIEPPGVVSLQVAEVASGLLPDARFLPEERNDTLVDALGLCQSCDTGLLHDLLTGHLGRLMRVVGINDLACSCSKAFNVGTHVPDG